MWMSQHYSLTHALAKKTNTRIHSIFLHFTRPTANYNFKRMKNEEEKNHRELFSRAMSAS